MRMAVINFGIEMASEAMSPRGHAKKNILTIWPHLNHFECPLSMTFSSMSRVHCERGGILSRGKFLLVHSWLFVPITLN